MALTIVRVTSGGIPVTESDRGMPYYEADNGFGIPVTFVAQGGAPLGRATGSGAQIQLSNASFTAGAAQGTAIGTLSVTGATGTAVFTLTDSHTNAVQVAGVNGVNLQVGSAASSAGSFSITVHVTGVTPAPADRVFLITANGTAALKFNLASNSQYIPLLEDI